MSMRKKSRYLVGLAGLLVLVSLSFCGKSGTKEASTKSIPPKITPLADSAYRAELTLNSPLPSAPAGSKITVGVTVKNLGDAAWPANGKVGYGLVHLAYHWLDRNGKTIVLDGWRTPLPAPLEPGSTVMLWAKVDYPKEPGDYILVFDLVHEMATWFADKKSPTVRVNVKVT
jgi:hypothetical protein